MALLVGAAGGAAAVQFQVELIAPHRQTRAAGLQAGQVVAQAAVALGQRFWTVAPQAQLLQHFGTGAAAVVAHARQPQGFADAAGPLPVAPIAGDGQGIAIGADRSGVQGQQLGATATAPAKQSMGEWVGGIPGQLVGAEPAHASGRRHRRQAAAEAKTVRQPGQGMLQAWEKPPTAALALLELPQQRGGGDQQAVGFHPGPIDWLEATGLHGGQQPLEQARPLALQPAVEGGRGVAEVELWVALHQLQHRGEGALGRLPSVGHRPQPGQVQVGMTQHMHPWAVAAGGAS